MSSGFIFSVRTYSPLHAGIGQSIEKVDLPIEREKHTQYPCVYATGMKGSLRSFCEKNGGAEISEEDVKNIFGDEDSNSAAGGAVFTELKTLLFPVRASEGSFKWVTSEKVIERFIRDIKLATGQAPAINFGPKAKALQVVTNIDPNRHILLEDFVFEKTNNQGDINFLNINLKDIYVVEENIFNYFVNYATQIIARNKLKENKTSDNLWYEEALPADTILYSFILPSISNNTNIGKLKNFLNKKVVQIGGNETVGYGISEINIMEGAAL